MLTAITGINLRSTEPSEKAKPTLEGGCVWSHSCEISRPIYRGRKWTGAAVEQDREASFLLEEEKVVLH